jgi:hypothetical protein
LVSFGLPVLSLQKSSAGSSIAYVQQPRTHESYQAKDIKSSVEMRSEQNENSPKANLQPNKRSAKEESIKSAEQGVHPSEGSNERKSKSVFPWILVLLLVLSFFIVLFSGLYLLNDNVSGFVHKLLNQESKENIMDDLGGRESDSSIKSMDDGQTEDGFDASAEGTYDSGDNEDCVIIVGLFGDQKNVRRIVDKISEGGYDVYRRKLASGEQLGIYTSCNSYTEALKFAKEEIASDAFLKNLSE